MYWADTLNVNNQYAVLQARATMGIPDNKKQDDWSYDWKNYNGRKAKDENSSAPKVAVIVRSHDANIEDASHDQRIEIVNPARHEYSDDRKKTKFLAFDKVEEAQPKIHTATHIKKPIKVITRHNRKRHLKPTCGTWGQP